MHGVPGVHGVHKVHGVGWIYNFIFWQVKKTQEKGTNMPNVKIETTLVKCRSARVCPERLKNEYLKGLAFLEAYIGSFVNDSS